ncbi:helix-turn-helix domain-containing protein [uncultured Dysosmobacter sp.]|uniref:helix-turn-helix domain-containing protein n=1 Tax=uncultured Dysosmobacter sp. TaxID=2591384 RepID=UPI002614C3C2|nr:helix-turn-helix transcriptional regulator [uncultured Dysosmobacter sp.]
MIFSIFGLVMLGLLIFFLVLIARALLKYIYTKDIREERSTVKKSLGEAIKAHRARCKMSQEFVAEAVGVSRQAVSKWELGTSEPSTSNLLALAKLFGISAEELLREVQ